MIILEKKLNRDSNAEKHSCAMHDNKTKLLKCNTARQARRTAPSLLHSSIPLPFSAIFCLLSIFLLSSACLACNFIGNTAGAEDRKDASADVGSKRVKHGA